MGEKSAGVIASILGAVGSIVVGKDLQVRQAFSCLLAGGHVLLEDVPGVGKTTLSHAFAVAFGLEFNRVQFTSDMLPSDVIGVSVFSRESRSFEFRPGPIFTHLLLADEINRANPKTQSAMLEAMEERQVSYDGVTRQLPAPFFVIATQNPSHQIGTFPLPESQLDRFLMKVSLGYPSPEDEVEILLGADRRHLLGSMAPAASLEELRQLQEECRNIHVSKAMAVYVQSLVAATRSPELFVEGVSPRGAIAVLKAAKAWALMDNRDHIVPEDIKAVAAPVMAHRLRIANGVPSAVSDLLGNILSRVIVPL